MKKRLESCIFQLGIAFFALGLLLMALLPDAEGALGALPPVMSGFGAGLTGVGVVTLFKMRMARNNPEKAKQYEINEKDERNIRLREKAGYATWFSTLFVLAFLSLALLVLDYKVPCFMAIGAMLLHIVSMFVYIYIYDKRI